MDKFSNLFFVDIKLDSINYMSKSEISKTREATSATSAPVYEVRYDVSRSRTLQDVQAIDIEREYLYWTNSQAQEGHGAIHKGFTDPFIRAAPFQSYEARQVQEAISIETNNQFLFYTG